MNTIEIILLIICSVFIIWFSWYASLRDKRYHGIYRFFVFESILFLIFLNYPYWFFKPFSIIHIFSWLFLISSIPIGLIAFIHLRRGLPQGRFENTTKLVDTGIYKFIRHPMYLSLILLGIGIYLKKPDEIYGILLIVINMLFSFLTAKTEESEMMKKFNMEYQDYMKHSKMFFPYLF